MQWVANLPAVTVHNGTSKVQRMVIARQLLKDYVVRSLPACPGQSLFFGLRPSYPFKELLRKAVKVLRNLRCRHRVVQSFAHERQHIVEFVGKVLLRPIALPSFSQIEEHINGPTVRIRSAWPA